MASRNRITKLRLPRNGSGRHRSLAGALLLADYIDPTNGERVLVIEQSPVAVAKVVSKPQKSLKPRSADEVAAFQRTQTEAPSGQ